jgi:LacI family transcriptional regulator
LVPPVQRPTIPTGETGFIDEAEEEVDLQESSGRPVTIAQVARDAGVSIPTVSRVVNGSAPVAEETRRRVVDSIERLGYHPNPMARGLSRGLSDVVLVILPRVTQPSVTLRLSGLISVLRDTPYELHLIDLEHPESERRRSLARLVAQHHAAGAVIISLEPSADDGTALLEQSSPVVLIDVKSNAFPSDGIDDVAGGMLATRHLLGLGHRRIAFVGDAEDRFIGQPASAERRRGYEQVLFDAGIDHDHRLEALSPHGLDTARDVASALLDGPDRPTAVFAASDVQAFGVMEAARSLGLQVPGDLSVVGFDDIVAARLVGLTTVRQHLEISGVRAGLRLLELLGHPLPFEMPPFPDLEVVVRGTTGPPGVAGTQTRSIAGAAIAASAGKQVSTAFDPAIGRGERIPRRK